MFTKNIFKSFLMIGSICSLLSADCKFPDPCGQMLKQHETIVLSQKNREKIQSQKFSESSLDWAWEKLFHQITYGGKRLNAEVPQGMPSGDVFSTAQGLKVDVNVQIVSFLLIDNGRVVWSLNKPSNSFLIPNTILKKGKTYTWEAEINDSGDRYDLQENFTMLDGSQNQLLQKEKMRLDKDFSDPTSRDFAFAVFCFDSGYEYNGDMIIQNLMKGIQ